MAWLKDFALFFDKSGMRSGEFLCTFRAISVIILVLSGASALGAEPVIDVKRQPSCEPTDAVELSCVTEIFRPELEAYLTDIRVRNYVLDQSKITRCGPATTRSLPPADLSAYGEFLKSAHGFIHNSLLEMAPAEWQNYREKLTQCSRDRRAGHKLAFRAAESVYGNNAPPGYRLVRALHDSGSGFDAALYEPITKQPGLPAKHSILAITGTDSAKGMTSDLAFGRSQFERNKELVGSLVRERLFKGEDVVITGHSLGGGLAQSFTDYTLDSLRDHKTIEAGVPAGLIHLVTWNGFGASSIYRKDAEDHYRAKAPSVQKDRDIFFQNPEEISVPFLAERAHYRTFGDAISLLGSFANKEPPARTLLQGNDRFLTQKQLQAKEVDAADRALAHQLPAFRAALSDPAGVCYSYLNTQFDARVSFLTDMADSVGIPVSALFQWTSLSIYTEVLKHYYMSR